FFHQQAEEYRKALKGAEEKLTSFSKDQGVVNPTLEKEMSVRKLAEFEAEQKTARATVAESRQRIAALEAQLGALPNRQPTQVRTSRSEEHTSELQSRFDL